MPAVPRRPRSALWVPSLHLRCTVFPVPSLVCFRCMLSCPLTACNAAPAAAVDADSAAMHRSRAVSMRGALASWRQSHRTFLLEARSGHHCFKVALVCLAGTHAAPVAANIERSTYRRFVLALHHIKWQVHSTANCPYTCCMDVVHVLRKLRNHVLPMS
jgi:hypothetical protein